MKGFTAAIDARLCFGTNTGDSTYWTELVTAMARIEFPVQIVLFSDRVRPESLADHAGVEWIQLAAPNSRWWSLVSFPLAARRIRADVVHTQYFLSPLVRRGGVTTVHDVSFLIGPQWFKPKDRTLLSATVPASCRRAKKVITVSQTSRAEIEKLIPAAKGKTAAIYNACPSWIHRIDRVQAKQFVASRLGIEKPYLLTVGTRWPRKNMGLAVDAADLLPREAPHKLVITGKSGWGEAKIGIRGLEVGYVDSESLCALYSAADLYLAPSFHEGFGIPLLEAFRCGCPVVCSEGGAFPEIAGNAAEIQRGWEPAEWSASTWKLLQDQDRLKSLSARGETRENDFSWSKAARETLEVYREAAFETENVR